MNSNILLPDYTDYFNQVIKKDARYKEYKCPCGKSYYSWPALFTHIRNKHRGKPPGEVIRPQRAERGRPIRQKSTKQNSPIQTIKSEFFQQVKMPPEQQLIYLLVRIGSDLPVQVNIKSKGFLLFNKFRNLNAEQKNQTHSIHLTYYDVVIKLLKQLENHIGRKNNIINGLIIIFGLWFQYIDCCYLKSEGIKSYCELNPPQNMFYFANGFVTQYLPSFLRRNNLQKWNFFRKYNINKMLELISVWFYQKEQCLTYLKLKQEQEQNQ